MPRSKSLAHYPARYGEIIEACAVRGEEIRVPLDSALQAAKLRGHFYAYVGALRREAHGFQLKQTMLTAGELEVVERAGQSQMVLLQIEAGPGSAATLRFCNREQSWQALALTKATSTQSSGQPTTAPALDDIAARLMQITPEGGKDGTSH